MGPSLFSLWNQSLETIVVGCWILSWNANWRLGRVRIFFVCTYTHTFFFCSNVFSLVLKDVVKLWSGLPSQRKRVQWPRFFSETIYNGWLEKKSDEAYLCKKTIVCWSISLSPWISLSTHFKLPCHCRSWLRWQDFTRWEQTHLLLQSVVSKVIL